MVGRAVKAAAPNMFIKGETSVTLFHNYLQDTTCAISEGMLLESIPPVHLSVGVE